MYLINTPGADVFAFFFGQVGPIVKLPAVLLYVFPKQLSLHTLQNIFYRSFGIADQRVYKENIILMAVFFHHISVFYLIHAAFYLLGIIIVFDSHFINYQYFCKR